jgi:hypothetical protein
MTVESLTQDEFNLLAKIDGLYYCAFYEWGTWRVLHDGKKIGAFSCKTGMDAARFLQIVRKFQDTIN